MSSVAQHLITAEEFSRLPGNERQELVRGEIVEMMRPSKEHGKIAAKTATLLQKWVEQGAGGEVGVEAGFILAHDPDTVRGPDVYYVSNDRLAADDKANAFWTVAPDLAVEVVSPSETADEVLEKISDYLAAGAPLVWVIYPRTRKVLVHTPGGMARTYGETDTIEHPDVLPGFSCKVADLFN